MNRINLHNYEAFLLDHIEGNLDAEATAELRAFGIANPHLLIEMDDADLPYLPSEIASLEIKSSLKKSEDSLHDEELLNYLENRLDATGKAKFEAKLKNDEELVRDFYLYSQTKLKAEGQPVFENKPALLKNEDDLALNNQLIAYMERQLPAQEAFIFEKRLKADKALRKEYELFAKTRLVADQAIVFGNKESLKKEGRVLWLNFRTVGSMAAAVLLLFGLFAVVRFYTGETGAPRGVALVTPSIQPGKATQPETGVQTEIISGAEKTKQGRVAGISKVPGAVQAQHFDSKENISEGVSGAPAPEPSEKTGIAPQAQEQPPVAGAEKVQQEIEKNGPVQEQVAQQDSPKTEKSGLFQDMVLAPAEDYKPVTTLAVIEDDSEDLPVVDKKESFWKRAVKAAKRANALGIKSVDGEETSNNAFYLSFNSFSVEKK